MANSWFPYHTATTDTRLRLFCFPFAGGTATLFRHWSAQLPTWVEVVAVQLPGRDGRRQEPLYTSVAALVSDLSKQLIPILDQPFAFFGHSLGAIISFELARELRRQNKSIPSWLCLSARCAPQSKDDKISLSSLDSHEFTQHMLHRYQGIPEEILREPELMNLFIPILRADITMVETYEYKNEVPLECPVTVIGGTDDLSVTMTQLNDWRQHTSVRFSLRQIPGDHFFIRSNPHALLRIIAEELTLFNAMNQFIT